MADSDLNAELENLFGNSEPKQEPAEPTAAPSEPKQEPPTRKPMLGGGAKPLGRGLAKPSPKKPAEAPKPAPAAATGPAPKTPAANPAPLVPPPAAPAASGTATKVTLVFAILSTFFSLVLCLMLNNANQRVSNLQGAIETLSQRQTEQAKKVDDLKTGLTKFSSYINDQVGEKSELNRRMKILTEAVETLQEKFGHK
ncbi:MAG: hypothetical protein ACI4WT_00795 [Oligosphaeraceae bacterium]